MQITDIDQKIKFNPSRIHRLISREVGKHINGLTEPCYEVKTHMFHKIMYRELGVTEKEWKAAANASEDTLGPKGKGMTYRVPFTFALAYLCYRYIKANKLKMARDIALYHWIKTYGSLREKYFPNFCDDDTFRYTIINLVKVHVFHREKTIANSLMFWNDNRTIKYYFPKIKMSKEWNPELMHDYMHDFRNKLNQSMRSFASAYMNNIEAGKKISSQKDSDDEDERNLNQTTTAATGKAAIENFIKSMYVYKSTDNKSVTDSKKFSRVKNNLAEMILPMILEKSSQENVKIILTNFMKELSSRGMDSSKLCGPEMIKMVKKMMLVRNYKDTFSFKSLVVTFTDSMVDRLDPRARKINQRDKVNLDAFVALYLTIRFRNLFC